MDTLCANQWLARKPDVRVHVQKNAEDAVKTNQDWNRVVRGRPDELSVVSPTQGIDRVVAKN